MKKGAYTHEKYRRTTSPALKFAGSTLVLMVANAVLPTTASASVIGFLGNFDVINDTGTDAHGFEIDLEGIHSTDVTDTFGGPGRGFPTGRGFTPGTSVERYGSPTIADYSNGSLFGVKVVYQGIFSNGTWDFGTPTVAPGHFATPGDNCWTGGGLGYGASTPCDHFGVGTKANPTKTTYSWLTETSPGSGTLTGANGAVSLPAPVWNVTPPAVPNAQPVLVAQVQAPAPQVEAQFGDALWVKVFTTELADPVKLEDLVHDNAKVQQAQTEVEWQLLQKDPGNPKSGILENGGNAAVGNGKEAVLRRYESFKFAGTYDPETHEALLSPGSTDSSPLPIDVGNYIGDQNAAVNLVAPVPLPPALALFGPAVALFWNVRRKVGPAAGHNTGNSKRSNGNSPRCLRASHSVRKWKQRRCYLILIVPRCIPRFHWT